MKKTNLSIEFVQGANKLNVANVQIDSIKIDEIAYTLANKVLTARANMLKYNAKIKGFSFNRKFDIMLKIEGCDNVNLSDLFGNLFEARTTLFASNKSEKSIERSKKSFETFASIIYDMTFCAMTMEHKNVLGKGELEPSKLIG
jgi:hypothetical protein